MGGTLAGDTIVNSAQNGPPNFPFGFMGGLTWVSFAPSGTWTSNTTYTGFYNQQGKNLVVRIGVFLSGAPSATALSINIPTGFTLNTAALALNNGAVDYSLGQVYINIAGGTYLGYAGIGSSSPNIISPTYATGSPLSITSITDTAPAVFASGSYISLSISMPVL